MIPVRRKIDMSMKDFKEMTHHPVITELVDMLCTKTQNTDRGFFQVEVAYFLGKVAGTMRAKLLTKDRGEIPVNIYAMALATSGYGKGHSINIMETEILSGFKSRFLEETFITASAKNLNNIAINRAVRNGTTEAEELESLEKEFRTAGTYAFTFDSGTPAAIKQMRHKLLLANCGAINLQIDEIGLNLLGSTDVLTVFLELYDQGIVKQKLTKNTAENTRGEELDGKTPTNALLFGTPSKLFDGAQSEDQFYTMLDTGYARRCLFGWGQHKRSNNLLTPEEIYAELTKPTNMAVVQKWKNHFSNLGDVTKYDMGITVPENVAIELLKYRILCEERADQLAEHEEIKKAEMGHRYFKALKLAGAYAFVDEVVTLSISHLHSAIKLVEESGEAFDKIMNREKTYVKLARYIAACKTEVTHADLNEALPFYKSGTGARNEMMAMAMSWGFKNNVMIKKSFVDGIELFEGETLTETDLNKLMISHSNHMAYNYAGDLAPFDKLELLLKMEDMHWCNHRFINGHRTGENVIKGFNLLVLDVDGTTTIGVVENLLKDYKYIIQTTKRHIEEVNRFRLIMPINYHLELDGPEYKEFMTNVLEWLPFEVDEAANQRERKWTTNPNASIVKNEDGDVLDVLRFVPRTSKNEAYRAATKTLTSYDNLERWFAQRMANGNRNNQMIKFALALVDSGMPYHEVETRVIEFNDKLSNKLSEDELRSTVLRSVASRMEKAS
jgi:hypothetical protein